MRKLKGDFVFPISGAPVKDGVVLLDDDEKVVSVEKNGQFDPAEVESFHGVLCPGFVNSHCHLELSFMKQQIPEKTGLKEFVKTVVAIRDNFTEEVQQNAIESAEREMVENGIVAVGDISNDTRSFDRKSQGNLRYHTFVEVFDLGPENTLKAFETGKKVFKKVPQENQSTASMTPHAPYSCTPDLYWLVDKFTARYGGMISIHNQENIDENKLFLEKKGIWADLFDEWGLDHSWFQPTGKNSLPSTLENIKNTKKVVNIHNTFTTRNDIDWAKAHVPEAFWCFCPNANLFIENTLPDFPEFMEESAQCVVGTDSLASNWQLSVLEELKVIEANAPQIPMDDLLSWATLNGAKLLDFDQDLGSLEAGKKPGINLIENMDLDTMKLTTSARVKKIA